MNQDTKEMFNILSKLDKVDKTTRIVAENAQKDVELKMAITQKINENSVSVQNYRVDIILQPFAGRQKKFYNVVEGDRILYRELALFETAMGIIKSLMTGKTSKVQELASYDEIYANNLYEVYMHNSRIKKGTINEDVAVAKSDRAKQKMYEAKNLLLNSNKARSMLGWQPKLSTNQSIDTTALWYKNYLEKPSSVIEFTEKQITEYNSLIKHKN